MEGTKVYIGLWALIGALTLSSVSVRAQASSFSDNERVAPILKGQLAHCSGLLVPEKRYIKFLEAELLTEELQARLIAQQRLTKSIETIYQRKLSTTERTSWLESPAFHRWLGFGLGVLFSSFVFLESSRLTK